MFSFLCIVSLNQIFSKLLLKNSFGNFVFVESEKKDWLTLLKESLCTKMSKSLNLGLVVLHGRGGGACVLQLCLRGVSWEGHVEFRFFFLPPPCLLSWKETLQNSGCITLAQKEMSEWILSGAASWISVGQRGSW